MIDQRAYTEVEIAELARSVAREKVGKEGLIYGAYPQAATSERLVGELMLRVRGRVLGNGQLHSRDANHPERVRRMVEHQKANTHFPQTTVTHEFSRGVNDATYAEDITYQDGGMNDYAIQRLWRVANPHSSPREISSDLVVGNVDLHTLYHCDPTQPQYIATESGFSGDGVSLPYFFNQYIYDRRYDLRYDDLGHVLEEQIDLDTQTPSQRVTSNAWYYDFPARNCTVMENYFGGIDGERIEIITQAWNGSILKIVSSDPHIGGSIHQTLILEHDSKKNDPTITKATLCRPGKPTMVTEFEWVYAF